VLPWRYDAEMGTGNSLHASANSYSAASIMKGLIWKHELCSIMFTFKIIALAISGANFSMVTKKNLNILLLLNEISL